MVIPSLPKAILLILLLLVLVCVYLLVLGGADLTSPLVIASLLGVILLSYLVGRLTAVQNPLHSRSERQLQEDKDMAGVKEPDDSYDMLYISSLSLGVERILQAKEELRQKMLQIDRLQALLSRAYEETKRKIALDVHDGLAQLVVCALQELRVLERNFPSSPDMTLRVRRVEHLLDQARTEMERIIFDLHPPGLDGVGLIPALEEHLRRYQETTGLCCHLQVEGQTSSLAPDVELGIYRIVQEALHNVMKHAEASNVRVLLTFGTQRVSVVVCDDGQGFDVEKIAAAPGEHLGLLSMKERARDIGARLEVESVLGQGTKVIVER